MRWILSAITTMDRQHINLCQRSGNLSAGRNSRQGATANAGCMKTEILEVMEKLLECNELHASSDIVSHPGLV